METLLDWIGTAAIIGGPITLVAIYITIYRARRGHYPPRHDSPHMPR